MVGSRGGNLDRLESAKIVSHHYMQKGNGDGYGDVIVGECHNDAGGTDAGRAYIYTSRSRGLP